ncbi:hypothetical protein ACFE04_011370 [Oxalis oulophora]
MPSSPPSNTTPSPRFKLASNILASCSCSIQHLDSIYPVTTLLRVRSNILHSICFMYISSSGCRLAILPEACFIKTEAKLTFTRDIHLHILMQWFFATLDVDEYRPRAANLQSCPRPPTFSPSRGTLYKDQGKVKSHSAYLLTYITTLALNQAR